MHSIKHIFIHIYDSFYFHCFMFPNSSLISYCYFLNITHRNVTQIYENQLISLIDFYQLDAKKACVSNHYFI